MKFTYTYTNTVDDYAIAENNTFLFIPKKFFLDYILPVIVLPVVEISMVISYINYDYTFVRVMSIVLIILSILGPLIALFKAPKVRYCKFKTYYTELFQNNKYLEGQKKLVINNNNISLKFNNGKEFNLVSSNISKVFIKNNRVNIYIDNYKILTVIPFSTFKTMEERNLFISHIKQTL